MGQPEELLPLIRPYFLLQLTSLVFVMMFNSFKQFADGITDTKTSMWIMLSANLLNIIGNSLLIYGVWGLPALGLTGAGISTLTSRIFMFVAFAVLFFSLDVIISFFLVLSCNIHNALWSNSPFGKIISGYLSRSGN